MGEIWLAIHEVNSVIAAITPAAIGVNLPAPCLSLSASRPRAALPQQRQRADHFHQEPFHGCNSAMPGHSA